MPIQKLPGFTLIEVLVVIALIAILAAITIIAINPQRNFQEARDTERQSEVTQIVNAVTQYTSEDGNALADLGTILACDDGAGGTQASVIGTSDVDLQNSALVETYIVSIPQDPQGGTDADTGYTICTTAGGRIEVAAPSAEGDSIAVQR